MRLTLILLYACLSACSASVGTNARLSDNVNVGTQVSVGPNGVPTVGVGGFLQLF